MCVILYKPAGVPFPEKSVIDTCFLNNPDGAGYAVKREGSCFVEYRKGFFTVEALFAALIAEDIQDGDTLAVHFRIATNGATVEENCHPFFITPKEELAYSVAGSCKSVLFHNGVLSKKYSADKKVSDTYLFTLALANREKELIKKETLKDFIAKETEGSRILYFSSREILLTGDWEYDELSGCFFSNLSYLPYYERYSYSTSFGSYDWRDVGYGFHDGGRCPACKKYGELVRISEYYDLNECGYCGALCDSHGHEIELFIK